MNFCELRLFKLIKIIIRMSEKKRKTTEHTEFKLKLKESDYTKYYKLYMQK